MSGRSCNFRLTLWQFICLTYETVLPEPRPRSYLNLATIGILWRLRRYNRSMAKTLVVTLKDDLDGGDADETVRFALDGKSYEIDLSKKNAAALRGSLKLYLEKGRSVGGRSRRSGGSGRATRFSKLGAKEKERFRRWAKLPNARRIADAKVEEWIKAGKP